MERSVKITWIPLIDGEQTLITNGNGTHPWKTILSQTEFIREMRGYQFYGDTDGIYLWIIDQDGNVGMLDAGEEDWSDGQDWIDLAFDPERTEDAIIVGN